MSGNEAIPEFLNEKPKKDDEEYLDIGEVTRVRSHPLNLNRAGTDKQINNGKSLISHDSEGREYAGGSIERPAGSVLAPEEFDQTGGDFPRDQYGNRVFGATLKN